MLLLKIEEPELEDYSFIEPPMEKNRKLKISTFKVDIGGKKIGHQFMKIVFEQALLAKVDEIYVTIYDNNVTKRNLICYFEKYGFHYHGKKNEELVYIRKI